MQPHRLTIQFSILCFSALFLATFTSNLVSPSRISPDTEWQPVGACVTWKNVCVCLWLSSVTKYTVPSLWVQRPGLTLSHSISMPTCPLAPSAPYVILHTRPARPFFSLPRCLSVTPLLLWALTDGPSSDSICLLPSITSGCSAELLGRGLCACQIRYPTSMCGTQVAAYYPTVTPKGEEPTVSLHSPDWVRRSGCGLLMGPPHCSSAPEASASVTPGTGHRLINLLK